MHTQKPIIARGKVIRFSQFLADAVRLVLLVWLSATLPARGAGTAGDYFTDVWISENGLPDSSVTAIAQTPDGYLLFVFIVLFM